MANIEHCADGRSIGYTYLTNERERVLNGPTVYTSWYITKVNGVPVKHQNFGDPGRLLGNDNSAANEDASFDPRKTISACKRCVGRKRRKCDLAHNNIYNPEPQNIIDDIKK